MTPITRTCDACGEILRMAGKYSPMKVGTKPSKYQNLCWSCFNKWLDGELEE